MTYTTDVSTVHVPKQYVVKSGYVWTYNGWPCWGIIGDEISHDAVYDGTDYVKLEYADPTVLRVYKELKRW